MLNYVDYQGFIEKFIIIHRPASEVYEALHYLRKWKIYLPHIKELEVHYDDGIYQEFTMSVLSNNNEILTVRSVRQCKNNEIKYFQPEPPRFLKQHAGKWAIKPLTNNSCKLFAYHFWSLATKEANRRFNNSQISVQDQVKNLLGEHALFTMKTWKKILEMGEYK